MSFRPTDFDLVRTSLRQHIRSLPPSHRSPRLHRHLLLNEKERLEKEIMRLERRCCLCRRQVAEIQAQLEGERRSGTCTAAVAPTERSEGPALSEAGGARERVICMTVEY